MKDTLQVIEDITEFKISVRNNVFKTFLLSFIHNEFFLDQYEESLLTEQIVDYWVKQFVKEEHGHFAIYDSKLIKLEKALYKDFVEAIMGKLVDDGFLQMCWDTDLNQIIWKKKEID
jgi:hypothetical protein